MLKEDSSNSNLWDNLERERIHGLRSPETAAECEGMKTAMV